MAEAEQPQRLRPEHRVTVDDVRQLMGASTPHFALQLRERLRRLIGGLELPPVSKPKLYAKNARKMVRFWRTAKKTRRGLGA